MKHAVAGAAPHARQLHEDIGTVDPKCNVIELFQGRNDATTAHEGDKYKPREYMGIVMANRSRSIRTPCAPHTRRNSSSALHPMWSAMVAAAGTPSAPPASPGSATSTSSSAE